jgi:hypothetical protein
MQSTSEKINFLIGSKEILEGMGKIPTQVPFSDNIIEFFAEISSVLLNCKEAKMYSDVMAYAFWIRKASFEREKKNYFFNDQRTGRGNAFQIAPSNIPVQFAVSMTYALIAGNASIVRVSNKEFTQVGIICEAVREALRDKCRKMIPYICIIRYDHDDDITAALSAVCDIRMIWGGDGTIAAIRNAKVSPRCVDIGFADRYSIAVIDSDKYLTMDADAEANAFYTDTYYSDQNACSSTRLVVWTGARADEAKKVFWDSLDRIVQKKYDMSAISSSNKLLQTAVVAAHHPGIRQVKKDNLCVRVELPELYDDIMEYKGNCGYFFEYMANDLEELIPLFGKECQTVTYLGDDIPVRLRKIIQKYGVRGVDRIVRVGRSMELSFKWDGFDLPIELSREISNM